ncbi:MAG TPA: DUF6292 family protein [Streptosporangiaceae bacterium]|jgi:hypothetical protein
MNPSITPDAHPDPWLDLLRGYVADTVRALAAGGLRPQASWLDPRDPRDATILLADATRSTSTRALRALVWDEETGWRTGAYVSGGPGVRTRLAEPAYLGGGVLVGPDEVASRLSTGAATARRAYRSRHDLRDGFDDALRTF